MLIDLAVEGSLFTVSSPSPAMISALVHASLGIRASLPVFAMRADSLDRMDQTPTIA
jgi:hypothetical protein